MRLRFTKRAAGQIEKAQDYVAERSPQGASRVRARLQAVAALLIEHPYAGHATDVRGVRRIMVSPYPYLLFYRVTKHELIVQCLRQTSRDPSAAPGRA